MERRQYERVPACSDCILRFKNNNEIHGKLWDISEGGVCVAVFEEISPAVGDSCTIQFADAPGDGNNFFIVEPITICNITELQGGHRIGAAFLNKISKQCLDYIRILSARAILRSRSLNDF